MSDGGWWRGRSSSAGVSMWQGYSYSLLSWFLVHLWMAELGARLCRLGVPRSSVAASSFHCCLAFSRPAMPLLLCVCRILDRAEASLKFACLGMVWALCLASVGNGAGPHLSSWGSVFIS